MRAVFGLAWPILVSMLAYTVMSVVDTLFVGRLGTAPLAAIGIAASTGFLVFGFAFGLFGGLRIVVAQRTGAGRHTEAEALLWQGIGMAGVFGLLGASVAMLGPLVFPYLAGSPEVAEQADMYFGIRVLGAPITFLMVGIKSWFEGRGDTKTPMKANLIANGLNIALDPVFIFGWGPIPAMGISGAALTTVGSVEVAAVWLFLRSGSILQRTSATQRIASWREILRVGAPLGVRSVLEVGAWVLFTSLVARAGEWELAAHVVVLRIIMVSFLPGHAVSESVSVLVGQAIGAGRPEGAREAWRAGTILALGGMAAMAVLFVAIPEPLIAVFGADPQVVAVARNLLMIAACFQIFDALAMTSHGALSGAGDTRYVMVVGVAGGWLLNLPLAWVFVVWADLGARGAWYALTVEIVIVAIIYTRRVLGDRWMEAVVVEAPLAPTATVDVEVAA
jgi:MATE family multidrug resistance protein